MNIRNAKNSTGIIAAVGGLVFALVYVGLEILTENPQATNSISTWHTPLIWLLASLLFLLHVLRRGDGTRRQAKRTDDHVQFECRFGHPARIVLAVSYARPANAVLWWERLLKASLYNAKEITRYSRSTIKIGRHWLTGIPH